MMKKKTVAIVHYNTPELTEAAILSLRRHGGEDYRVVVFDNSDERPFLVNMDGVEVIDNTHGQVIDFGAFLSAFPNKNASIGCAKNCEWASVKHMRTVQELWRLLPDGFVLLESDVLLRRCIDDFFREDYAVVGYRQFHQPGNPFQIGRLMPMLCWMNVPVLEAEGVKYFDPARSYGLNGDRCDRSNWYDTGASLLEDVLTHKPMLKGLHVDIRDYIVHYGSGSWKKNSMKAQAAWLKEHEVLWLPSVESPCAVLGDAVEPPDAMQDGIAVCAIGRLENLYAEEWVEHYLSIGVEHIYVYDNNRAEDEEVLDDVLHDYVERGVVEITPWDGLQRGAYEDCYRRHGGEWAWIGFFDFDEFVMTDDHTDLKWLLDNKKTADVVCLNWMTMTDSGRVYYEDAPVCERFTEGTDEDFAINKHVKSFVRGGLSGVTFCDPHVPTTPMLRCVNVLGDEIEQKAIQDRCVHALAVVAHYDTKSAEEWAKIKMVRLSPCGDEFNQRMKSEGADYFFSINKRTAEKERVLGVKRKKKRCGHPKSAGKPVSEK